MLRPRTRTGQSARRADARYQIERCRVPASPTDQEASAEGAVFGTAGDWREG